MTKNSTLAVPHFGQRILQLAGESGLSLAEIARRADIPYRTLRNWIQKERRPRGGSDRIRRLEAVLGASLIEGTDPAMVMRESRGAYPAPRRFVQPLDFKKRALDQVGRARHVIAHLLDLAEAGHQFTAAELDEALVAMDNRTGRRTARTHGEDQDQRPGEETVRWLAAAALVLVACTYVGSGPPPENEQDRAFAALEKLQPGQPEDMIRDLFPSTTKPRIYHIVDIEAFEAQGYSGRTYWIGYWDSHSTGGYTAYTDTHRIAAIQTVNGIIESVYYP